MTSSFDRLASVHASTKRSPAVSGDKIGPLEAYLDDICIVDVMPVMPDIVVKYPIKSPRRGYVTFVSGLPDIKEGDRLVVGQSEYIVRAAEPWNGRVAHTRLILEEVVD